MPQKVLTYERKTSRNLWMQDFSQLMDARLLATYGRKTSRNLWTQDFSQLMDARFLAIAAICM